MIDFLNSFLPILIYLLLIILIIIGIVIGVKLLNFMTKAQDIIDNVDKKINTLNPVFDIINAASFKVNRVFDRFLDFFTSVFTKIFLKGKEREEEKIEKIFIRNTWNFGSRGEEHIRITHRKRCRYYLFDCICKSG